MTVLYLFLQRHSYSTIVQDIHMTPTPPHRLHPTPAPTSFLLTTANTPNPYVNNCSHQNQLTTLRLQLQPQAHTMTEHHKDTKNWIQESQLQPPHSRMNMRIGLLVRRQFQNPTLISAPPK